MQTASIPSSSFRIVPFTRALSGVARILVVNRDNGADFDALPADADDATITGTVGARFERGQSVTVLAELAGPHAVDPTTADFTDRERDFDSVDPTVDVVGRARLAATVRVDRATPVAFATAATAGSRGFSQDGADRAAADRELAARHGIALPPPVYVMGALLRDDGVARAESLRAEFDALPAANVALRELIDEVKAEAREDYDVVMSGLRMQANNRVRVVTPDDRAVAVGVERDSLLKIQRRMVDALDMSGDFGIVTLAGAEDSELRACAARTFNNTATAIERHEAKAATPTRIVLRTRLSRRAGDERQVFAAVSDSYGEIDIDTVAEAALTIPGIGGLKAAIHYDRTRLHADLFTQTTTSSDLWVAGEVYRAGHRITTNDTGGGSLKVESFVISNLCLNVMIVADVTGATTIIRHMGDKAKLRIKLREAMRRAHGVVDAFARQWNKASVIDLTKSVAPATRADQPDFAKMIERLVSDEAQASTIAHHAWGQSMLDGVYRSILRTEELVPVRRIEEVVPALRAAHWDPRNDNAGRQTHGGLTPAAIASGLTLWAQKLEPVEAHRVEVLGGQIVAGKRSLDWAAAPAR